MQKAPAGTAGAAPIAQQGGQVELKEAYDDPMEDVVLSESKGATASDRS